MAMMCKNLYCHDELLFVHHQPHQRGCFSTNGCHGYIDTGMAECPFDTCVKELASFTFQLNLNYK